MIAMRQAANEISSHDRTTVSHVRGFVNENFGVGRLAFVMLGRALPDKLPGRARGREWSSAASAHWRRGRAPTRWECWCAGWPNEAIILAGGTGSNGEGDCALEGQKAEEETHLGKTTEAGYLASLRGVREDTGLCGDGGLFCAEGLFNGWRGRPSRRTTMAGHIAAATRATRDR